MALQEGCYWSAAGCRLVPRQGPQAQGWRAVGGHAPAPVAVAVWVEASVRSPWNILCYTGLREKGAGPWRGWGPRPLTGLDCGKRLGTAVPGLCRSVRRFAFFVRELYVGGCEEPF